MVGQGSLICSSGSSGGYGTNRAFELIMVLYCDWPAFLYLRWDDSYFCLVLPGGF